jgi:hypothetical protein
MPADRRSRGGLFERLFRLDRKADKYFGRPVENLKDIRTEQAAKFALGPLAASQLNVAIASIALRTEDVALLHLRNMRRNRLSF